jgi:phage terminase large subunit
MQLKFNVSSENQKEAARAWVDPTVTDIVYGGAKGGGKSYLGAALIFGNALTYPGTRYFIARKQLTDLTSHTKPTIERVFRDWGISIEKYAPFNGQHNHYQCYNGSTVLLIAAKWMPSDPMYERFGSMTMTQGWIEEAGEFEDDAKKNLAISIGRWDNDKWNLPRKLLMTCNPKKNFLYKDFYLPWKNGTLAPNRRFIQAFAQDNTRLEKGYLDQLRENLTDRDKDRLLNGNWEYADSDDSLMEYDKILEIFDNQHVEGGAKYITVDVARLGGDRIVCILWDGFRGKVTWWKKETLSTTAARIETIRFKAGIGKSSVLIDADGLGVGLEDFVGYKGFVNNARPFPSPINPERDKKTGKPLPENFDHMKSQCYYRLADRVNKNGIYLEVMDSETKRLIVEEMEQVKQKDMDSDMKKGVLEKIHVKDLLGRSPDFSDSIMMREYFELKPKFVSMAQAI